MKNLSLFLLVISLCYLDSTIGIPYRRFLVIHDESNPWDIPPGPENNSFAKEVHEMMRNRPVKIKQNPSTTLRCEYDEVSNIIQYDISVNKHVTIKKISEYGFSPKSVCIYDFKNQCRSHPHLGMLSLFLFILFFLSSPPYLLDISSLQTFICVFKLKKMIITDRGLLIDESIKTPISFGHSTMASSGVKVPNIPQYAPVMSYVFLKGQLLPFLACFFSFYFLSPFFLLSFSFLSLFFLFSFSFLSLVK
jgi:hypothetical protein